MCTVKAVFTLFYTVQINKVGLELVNYLRYVGFRVDSVD